MHSKREESHVMYFSVELLSLTCLCIFLCLWVSGASGAEGQVLRRLHPGSRNSLISCHCLHRGAGREVTHILNLILTLTRTSSDYHQDYWSVRALVLSWCGFGTHQHLLNDRWWPKLLTRDRPIIGQADYRHRYSAFRRISASAFSFNLMANKRSI